MAEDELLELVDRRATSPEIVLEGIAFYERLLQKKDAELEAGEIYRDEIQDGLKELRTISNG